MVSMSHWVFSTPTSTLSVHWFSQLFHKALHWEAPWSFHFFPWDALGQSRTMKLFNVHGLNIVIPPFWRQLDVKFLSSFATSWATPCEPQNSIFFLGSPLKSSEVSIFLFSSWDLAWEWSWGHLLGLLVPSNLNDVPPTCPFFPRGQKLVRTGTWGRKTSLRVFLQLWVSGFWLLLIKDKLFEL